MKIWLPLLTLGLGACSQEYNFFSTTADNSTGGLGGDEDQTTGGKDSMDVLGGAPSTSTEPRRFSPPTLVEIATVEAMGDDDPSFTDDRLELYFSSSRSGEEALWTSRRASTNSPWGQPELLPESINSVELNSMPGITSDGLTLYFVRWDPDNLGTTRLFSASRTSRDAPFDSPSSLEIDDGQQNASPSATADNLFLVWGQPEAGRSAEIQTSSRASTTLPWGPSVPLTAVGSELADNEPWISDDRLHLFFRMTIGTQTDIVHTERSSADDEFPPAVPLAEINSPQKDSDPWFTQDLGYMMFSSNRSGVDRLYESFREAGN